MLVNNNSFTNDDDIERFNKITKNEESITREKLFSKQKELIEKLKPYSNLSITKSEFNLGFTIVADGKGLKNGEVVDKKVAELKAEVKEAVAEVKAKLPTAAKLKALTKAQLEELGRDFGIELDKRKTKEKMIADLKTEHKKLK